MALMRGVNAGSAFLRLGAITAAEGFSNYDRLVEKAQSHKEHYMRLGARSALGGFAQYDSAVDKSEKNTQRFAASAGRSMSEVDKATKGMAEASARYFSVMGAEMGRVREEYASVGEAARASARMQADAARQASGSNALIGSSARKAATDSGKAADSHAQSWKKAQGTLNGIAKTSAIAFGVIGVASIKMASDFNKEMELTHTNAGASQQEVDKLKQKVLDLAPAVGVGPKALSEGLFHIESAGFRGAAAMDILKMSAEGAKVGNADLQKTTYALLGVMQVAPKDIHGAAEAMGVLNDIVGHGDMRMNDLVGAMSTGIMPAAKSVGLGLRDVGAALDVMTTRGVPAQEAATRLRMTFSLMAAPTKQAEKSLQSIGLTQYQLAQDMHKPGGLAIAVEDLRDHLKAAGLTAEEQNNVIARAFGGGRSSSAIMTLVQNVDDLKKHTQQLNQGGAVQRFQQDWHAMQRQFSQQVAEMWAGLQKLLIQIGEALIPVVRKAVSAFNDFGKWLGRHKTVAKDLAYVLGTVLVAAILSVVVTIGQKIVGSIKVMLDLGKSVGALPGKFLSMIGPIGKSAEAVDALGVSATAATEKMALLAETQMRVSAGGVVLPGGFAGGKGRRAGALGADLTAEEAGLAGGAGGRLAGIRGKLSGIGGGLSSAGSKLMRGGMIAGTGVLVSQIAGSAIGGGTGDAVSSIGTAGSISAGIGSLLGPEGTIAGAILGAGVTGLKKLVDRSMDFGKKMGDNVGDSMKHTLVGSMPEVNKIVQKGVDDAQKNMPAPHRSFLKRFWDNLFSFGDGPPPKPSAQQQAEMDQAMFDTGRKAGKAWGDGMTKQAHYLDFNMVLQNADAMLKKMPAKMRLGALGSIQAWANEMVKEGRLPRGAADRLVNDITHHFADLKNQLPPHAKNAMKAIQMTIQDRGVIHAVGVQVDQIAHLWQGVPKLAKTTADNAVNNWTRMIEYLQGRLAEAKKHIGDPYWDGVRRDATNQLRALRDQTGSLMQQVVDRFGAAAQRLKPDAKKAYSDMVGAALQQMNRLGTGTDDAMKKLHVNLKEYIQGIEGNFGNLRDFVAQVGPQIAQGMNQMMSPQAAQALQQFEQHGATGARHAGAGAAGGYVTASGIIALASGGPVPGVGVWGTPPPGSTDTAPAWLTPGEYVVNKEAVQSHGLPKMHAINKGEDPSANAAAKGMVAAAAILIDGARSLGSTNAVTDVTTAATKIGGSVLINKSSLNQGGAPGYATGGLVSSPASPAGATTQSGPMTGGSPNASVASSLTSTANAAEKAGAATQKGFSDPFKKMVNTSLADAEKLKKEATQHFDDLAKKATDQSKTIHDKVTANFTDTQKKSTQQTQSLHDQSTQDFKDLQSKTSTTTQKIHDDVDQKFSDTRSKADHHFTGLHDDTDHHMKDTQSSVDAHSSGIQNSVNTQFTKARSAGAGAMSNLAGAVAGSFSSADSAVYQGAGYIETAVNEALKQLGASQIKFSVPAPHGLSAHSRGDYVGKLGDPGHDSVLGLFAPGEAILTHHHQDDFVEPAMAFAHYAAPHMFPYSNLTSMFSADKRAHYTYARGGQVQKFAGGGQIGNYAAMTGMANAIASHHYHYNWGGGHDPGFSPTSGDSPPGYDCSGAVSSVLHAGGLLKSPLVAQDFMSWGMPGSSKGLVKLYASPGHVYMSMGSRYFGTSESNPGGGAGWFNGGPRSGFVQRTVPSNANINIPKIVIQGPAGSLLNTDQTAVNDIRTAGNKKVEKALQALISRLASGSGDGGDSGAYQAEPGGWFKVGATYEGLDGAQTGSGQPSGGNNFAELLVAGANAGMYHEDLSAILGLSNPPGMGMPYGTQLGVRLPGSGQAVHTTKNDVGSGQAGNAHYKMDIQTGLMHMLNWTPNNDVEVHKARGGFFQKFQTGGRVRSATSRTSNGVRSIRRHGQHRRDPFTWLYNNLSQSVGNKNISVKGLRGSHGNLSLSKLPGGLGDLQKFANLPGVNAINTADASVAADDQNVQDQSAIYQIVDQQLTPGETQNLEGYRLDALRTLSSLSDKMHTADTLLANQYASDQDWENAVTGLAQTDLNKIAQLKQQLVNETRKLAKLKHVRAGKVLNLAQDLANRMYKNTTKRAGVVRHEASIRGTYKGRIEHAQKNVKAIQDRYANARANLPRGKAGTSARNALSRAERREVRNAQAHLKSVMDSRDHALSGPQKELRGLNATAAKQRKELGDKRRKYAKQGWEETWTYTVDKWKLQDAIKNLEDQAKTLTGSSTEIGTGGLLTGPLALDQEIATAQQALAQREQQLPQDLFTTAMDIVQMDQAANLPVPQEVQDILAHTGLQLPPGLFTPGAGGGAAGSPTVAAQAFADYQAFRASQQNLYSQFGSNFVAGPTMGAVLQSKVGEDAGAKFWGASGAAAAIAGGLQSTGAAISQSPSRGPSGSGSQFVQNNYYQQGPQDPHVHAQQSAMEFETRFG